MLKVHLASFAAPPAANGSCIAARLHGYGERLGSPEATKKEGDQQWTKLDDTLNEIALIKAHSTGGLGLYQSFYLSNKDGHEFEGYHKNHDKCIDGYTQLLQWCKQGLRTIGQVNQRGDEHQHRCQVIKEDDAHHKQ